MNSKTFLKVFHALTSTGMPEDRAAKIALQEAQHVKAVPSASRQAHVPSALPSTSVKSRVMSFCDKHRGSVWTLQNCARQLGLDPNVISPQLTKLIKEGYITRTGAGEYRKVF